MSRLQGLRPLWLALFALCLGAVLVKSVAPWLTTYPAGWQLPITDWVASVTSPVFAWLQPAGRTLAAGLDAPLRLIRDVLQWIPWPAFMLTVAALAAYASGWRLALFAVLSLGYLVITGYWLPSMSTLAIVAIAVPISVVAGFAMGALAHRVKALAAPIEGLLDLMQTVPAFAYLIPMLLVFGFGPAAGLVASIIYALPPMVRNTMLGLSQVPPEVLDAADMSGATPRQKFWLAEIPTALPRLLVGVNQTIMAALSIVIIVAVIGGFDDIGWAVLAAMRRAELGNSLMSGLVIVLIAILLDRITLGLATRNRRGNPVLSARQFGLICLGALVLGLGMKALYPGTDFLPATMGRDIARALDASLLDFVTRTGPVFTALRNAVTYSVMLPLRIGFVGAASPVVWGFALTPLVLAGYVLGSLALAYWAGRRAMAVLFASLIIFTGLPGFPWAGFIGVITLLAYAGGGKRLGWFAFIALVVILLAGLWLPLMQSAYLVAIAVTLCLLIGGALGVWAAQNNTVSRILQPINDTLQTMPQFVFLIPALMLFKVGEFTALIAIVLYAIVPPIRYVEQGLRTVPGDVVEAARQMGTTTAQLLWQVKVPMARPAILLGLNQTIMAALSMLVIAALVGTRDLGQQVYVALGKADPGLGIVAGLAIACVALVTDRMLRGYASAATRQTGST